LIGSKKSEHYDDAIIYPVDSGIRLSRIRIDQT